jgi:hypothetical protein
LAAELAIGVIRGDNTPRGDQAERRARDESPPGTTPTGSEESRSD